MGLDASYVGPQAQGQGCNEPLHRLLTSLAVITSHHKSPGISVAQWMPPCPGGRGGEPQSLVLRPLRPPPSTLPKAAQTAA